jgi:hypothetical protein
MNQPIGTGLVDQRHSAPFQGLRDRREYLFPMRRLGSGLTIFDSRNAIFMFQNDLCQDLH